MRFSASIIGHSGRLRCRSAVMDGYRVRRGHTPAAMGALPLVARIAGSIADEGMASASVLDLGRASAVASSRATWMHHQLIRLSCPTLRVTPKGVSGTQIHPSCCSGVFMDQPAESVAAVKLVWRAWTDET
jgi:hypothetical protein